MITYYQKVDRRSRKAMVDFLTNHFRYYTMNSWNRGTSYANNVKIYNLGLSREMTDKLYDMTNCIEFYDRLRVIIGEFEEAHNYEWQAGFNGRSSGYLVLYQGKLEPSGYKSFCPNCGQNNYKTVEESGRKCGRCGKETRVNFPTTHMRVVSYPGISTDADKDFDYWSMDELRDRVQLVEEFDQLCDSLLREAIYMAENMEVEDEEYLVPTTRKTLVEK
jgi:hypothetical protein